MKIASLKVPDTERLYVRSFGGYDKRPGRNGITFTDMENMTGKHYPLLATRDKRGILNTGDFEIFGILSLDLMKTGSVHEIVKGALLADCRGRLRAFYNDGVLLAMCRQATRRVPLFSTLVRIAGWRREELLHQLEVWIESEKMTPEEASAHQTALNEYRDGQRRLNNYLHTISTELGDLLAGGSVPPRDRVTIGSALQRGEVLALDVSGVHDRKCIFGILTMLLEDAIDKVGAGYLVLDGVSFMECERLSRLVTAESPRMGLHISASDISARCGNDADKLNAVLTGSRCSIILRHSNGRSCTCLSNGMGTYEHTEPEMIMHMGSHKSAKELLGGNDRSRGFNLKKEIRPRVQPGDIQTQNDGVAYVVSADNRQITLCPLSDN